VLNRAHPANHPTVDGIVRLHELHASHEAELGHAEAAPAARPGEACPHASRVRGGGVSDVSATARLLWWRGPRAAGFGAPTAASPPVTRSG
jgi:hypothetical protein